MLTKSGREVSAVFDLLGRKEVDLTAALGWVLSQSELLLKTLMAEFGSDIDPSEVHVALEETDSHGRTDIELTTGTTKVIIEAKQGWLVPGEPQLSRYTGRFDGFETSLLVSMSDSSEVWAHDQLPGSVDGVPVKHVSWDSVRTIVTSNKGAANGRQRWLLGELEDYMGQATSTRRYDDQWMFCVVVSDHLFGASTFREYVSKERVYFHPYGGNNGWPKVAPNFLCFRWEGQVRQVNRVLSFDLVPTLSDEWPDVDEATAGGPHIVYRLGPDIPMTAVSTKGTYASGRVWCLLDQLLVQPTLADAVRASKDLSSA